VLEVIRRVVQGKRSGLPRAEGDVGFVEFLQSRSGDIVTLGLQHLAGRAVAVLLATVIGVSRSASRPTAPSGPGRSCWRSPGAFLTIPSFALLVLFIGPWASARRTSSSR
jgi:ABC-type proline/glycine betaine transport system permease subunit